MAVYSTRSEWEAAQGGGGGSTLRSYFDFTGYGSADWNSDGARSITPDGGTVVSAMDWTVVNSAQNTSFGPDGTGLRQLPISNAGDWYAGNVPTCGYISVLISDLIGSTPNNDTDIWILLNFSYDVASMSNYDHTGFGLADSNTSIKALLKHDPTVRFGLSRPSGSVVWQAEAELTTDDQWCAMRVHGDGAQGRYGTIGTHSLPATWNDTGLPIAHASLRAAGVTAWSSPTTMDLSTAKLILFNCPNGAHVPPEVNFKSLKIYEVVP